MSRGRWTLPVSCIQGIWASFDSLALDPGDCTDTNSRTQPSRRNFGESVAAGDDLGEYVDKSMLLLIPPSICVPVVTRNVCVGEVWHSRYTLSCHRQTTHLDWACVAGPNACKGPRSSSYLGEAFSRCFDKYDWAKIGWPEGNIMQSSWESQLRDCPGLWD